MKMMKPSNAPFFVVGPPRSRSAWIANLLTTGDMFALHDGLRGCGSVGDLANKLGQLGVCFPGNVDPGLPHVFESIRARFPAARYVFITRDYDDALESYQTLMADHFTADQIADGFKRLDEALKVMRSALAGQYVLEVPFDELEQSAACRAIFDYCGPGVPWNQPRYEQLQGMRVNIIAEKMMADWDRSGRKFPKLCPATGVPVVKGSEATSLKKEYYAALRELCGTTEMGIAAYRWLCGMMNVALTFDHIADSDPVCKTLADDALHAVLLDWPANKFWVTYGLAMQTVISATLGAWQASDREEGERFEAWMPYNALPLAIAQLLGGRALVAKWNLPLRAIVKRMYQSQIDEDDYIPEEFRIGGISG